MKFLGNWLDRLKGRPDRNEVAVHDLALLSAVMSRLPDPDIILRQRGGRMELYRDMMMDDQVGHASEIIEMAVKSRPVEIDAAGSSDYMAGFCREMMQLWDHDNIVEQAINYRLLGYQPFELIYEASDRKWVITDVIGKPADWFTFNADRELVLTAGGRNQRVNPWNFITLVNKGTYDNPHGTAVLSGCFWPVSFKRGGVEFWVKFVEKYGIPYLIGKLPRGASAKEYDEMVERLDAMVQDAVAAIPSDNSVEILTDAAKGASGELHERHVRYHDAVIMKRIAGSTLISDQGGGAGSFALSKTHANTTQMIIDAVGERVLTIYNKAFKRATLLNRNGDQPPRARFKKKEGVQLEVAERDQRLYATGVRFRKSYYEDLYNLQPDDFDVTEAGPSQFFEAPAPSPAVQQHAAQCSCAGCRAARGLAAEAFSAESLPEPLREVESAITSGAADADSAAEFEVSVQQVIDLVSTARTPEQALDLLAEAYPELDTDRLQQRLERAMFVTAVWGRLTEQS